MGGLPYYVWRRLPGFQQPAGPVTAADVVDADLRPPAGTPSVQDLIYPAETVQEFTPSELPQGPQDVSAEVTYEGMPQEQTASWPMRIWNAYRDATEGLMSGAPADLEDRLAAAEKQRQENSPEWLRAYERWIQEPVAQKVVRWIDPSARVPETKAEIPGGPVMQWLTQTASETTNPAQLSVFSIPPKSSGSGSFTLEQMAAANRTARGGKFGESSAVANWVSDHVNPKESLLDFGSGPEALQTKRLRSEGFQNVDAHEFGNNWREGIHEPEVASRKYDAVMASKVLNVQTGPEMLRQTLGQIADRVGEGGRAIFNYPNPRESVGLTVSQFEGVAREFFPDLKRVGGTSSSPIWEGTPQKLTPAAQLVQRARQYIIERRVQNVDQLKSAVRTDFPNQKFTNSQLEDAWKDMQVKAAQEISGLTPEEASGRRATTIRSMVEIKDALPANDEWISAAITGIAKKGWYERSARVIRQLFGDDAEKFTGLLAALSPQQSVKANLTMALKVWREWTGAGRPTDIESLQRIVNEGSVDLKARVGNGIRALQGGELQDLSGYKVESFRRNLLGDVRAVTNDTHMADFGGVDPVKFKSMEQYYAFSAKTRDIAQIMGWDPREVQETIWSTILTLKEMAREGKMPSKITPETVNAYAPEFASLLLKDAEVKAGLRSIGIDVDAAFAGRPGVFEGGGANIRSAATSGARVGRSKADVARGLGTLIQRLETQGILKSPAAEVAPASPSLSVNDLLKGTGAPK